MQKTSRVSGARYKYGILGAGAVGASLIGRLPSRARDVGPVCAASFRLASRIANTLRGGYAARSADDLNAIPAVLVHAPAENLDNLLELAEKAAIEWAGKALIFCNCAPGEEIRGRLEAKGASTAVIREFGLPARIVIEAKQGAALFTAQRMARDLNVKAVRISRKGRDLFNAAVTLGSGAITPLIDHAATLLREAGIRDVEAARLASSVFEQTAREYAHSGKQSWAWYARQPDTEELKAHIARVGPKAGGILRELILFGFEAFGKHEEVAGELSRQEIKPAPPG